MKTPGKLLLSAVMLGVGIAIGSLTMNSQADGIVDANQPGSVNDPLVSKSYVDEKVAEIVKAELKKQQGNQGPEVSRELVVIELKPGQILYAGEGTEMIVRNGKAVSVSANSNGIPDLTDGKDLKAGTVIPNNHLLLFPREDGRGIQPHPDEKNTIFVMVRGKYLHMGADGKPVVPDAQQ